MKKLVLASTTTALLLLVAVAADAQPTQIGDLIPASFDSPHPYQAPNRGEAELLFTQEIHDAGASYIAPRFSRMELGAGDYVIVRAPDFSRSWRYEGYGKAEMGKAGNEGFWGIHIDGDRAVIELWGRSGGRHFGYAIDSYGRGFDDPVEPKTEDTESICTVDDKEAAICYTGSEIYEKARAVLKLTISGVGSCTGWLIGDEGHVMTNEHCIGTSTQAMNTDYQFMFEWDNCDETCTGSCNGIIEETSGTLIQASSPLDYSLVLLPNNHSGTYGFFQLRETGAALEERIWSPQHAGGRRKEFAVLSSYPENPSGFAEVDNLTEPGCSGPTPDVGYFMDTEGGSSGSAVLGWDDNLVVALHHCRGSAFCSTGNPDNDDPNRGVSIPAIIADLGANLPNNAIGSDAAIFDDGFESGDTSAWSTSVP